MNPILPVFSTAASSSAKWSKVETKEVSVASDSVDFTGLDGDSVAYYAWYIEWVKGIAAASAAEMYITPNSPGLDMQSAWYTIPGGSPLAVSSTLTKIVCATCEANSTHAINYGCIMSPSGSVRDGWALGASAGGTTIGSLYWLQYRMFWNQTATQITSLNFGNSAVSGTLGAGTRITLYSLSE